MALTRENIINEMVDYYEITSNIEYACELQKDVEASYDFDTNTIQICSGRLSSPDKFKKALLHEIGHAIQARDIGSERFTDLYNREWEILESFGKDPYWDNKYEKRAERFANQEMKNW